MRSPRKREEHLERAGRGTVQLVGARADVPRPWCRCVIATPASRSACPPMYFVALCTTTSAPSRSGCWRTGVANVLSTATNAPRVLRGWNDRREVGDLEERVRRRFEPDQVGVGRRIDPGGRVGDRDPGDDPTETLLGVAQPGADAGVDVVGSDHPSIPHRSRDSTALIAAMPDENATAAPPSSEPIAASNAIHVGVPSSRLYSGPSPAVVGEVVRGEHDRHVQRVTGACRNPARH